MSARAWKRRRNKAAWRAEWRAQPCILILDNVFDGEQWRSQLRQTDAMIAHVQRAIDAACARLAAQT